MNVGVSVSRVGGAAQIKAMKEVAGSLRLDLSQYRELEAFAAFASDLDAASKAQLDAVCASSSCSSRPSTARWRSRIRSSRSSWALRGHLDSVPAEDVSRFESEFLEHVKASHSEILDGIKESKKLSEEAEEKLVSAINEFKKGFAATDGSSVVADEHEADALDPEDLEKESVKSVSRLPRRTR